MGAADGVRPPDEGFPRFVTHYPLNEECLSAFLDAYPRGDREYAARCRKALEILKKHDRHRVWAGLWLWLLGPPPRDNGKTLETTG